MQQNANIRNEYVLNVQSFRCKCSRNANYISDSNTYQDSNNNINSMSKVKPPEPPKKKSASHEKGFRQRNMIGNQGSILINNDAEIFNKPLVLSQRNPKTNRSNN